MSGPPAASSGPYSQVPSSSSGHNSQPPEVQADQIAAPPLTQLNQPPPGLYQGQYTSNYAQTCAPPPINNTYLQYPTAGPQSTGYQTHSADPYAGYHQPQTYWNQTPEQNPYTAYYQPQNPWNQPPPPDPTAAYHQPYQQAYYPPAQASPYTWPSTVSTQAPQYHHPSSAPWPDHSHDLSGYSNQGGYPQAATTASQQQEAFSTPAATEPQTAPFESAPELGSGTSQTTAQEDGQQVKKRRLTSPKEEEPSSPRIVFVWDLDETLIVFQSLLTGKYADLEGLDEKRKEEGLKLGERWERLILDVSDSAMCFEQVEDFDQASIDHVAEHDDGASLQDFDFAELNLKKPLTNAGKRKLAYLYRHIQALYAKGASNLLTGDKRGDWQGLYAATDRYTGGWLSAGRRLLSECATAPTTSTGQRDPVQTGEAGSSRGEGGGPPEPGERTIVLVSSGQLIPTLTKCLLFRLDPWIDPMNVYSSKVVGKLQCFEWIRERFNSRHGETKYCVVGDGIEEQAAAKVLEWPFIRVASGLDPNMRLPNIKLKHLTDLLADNESTS